jgi:hypothetical protein
MSLYRNSILKFNPRSFLELENNTVNQQIENSIRKNDNNEFSLFNNGITIISDRTSISSDTAKKGTAQLILTNPQLVNGGQTAFVLSRIYEDCVAKNSFKVLTGKEVLLRIITSSVVPSLKNQGSRLGLISAISEASNSQTKIEEADRRSGDEVQIHLQEQFFNAHGMFYERKKGEFSDGLRDGYITQAQIIDRYKIIRVALATSYQIKSIGAGTTRFFKSESLSDLLKTKDIKKYVYGYEVLQLLEAMKKSKPSHKGDRFHARMYGQALRFGINAVVSVSTNLGLKSNIEISDVVPLVLKQWMAYEAWVIAQSENATFKSGGALEARNYYRGATINSDVQKYPFKTS